MKVKVRYWTEFGGSESTMNVEEIANFSERFKIMSVTPIEEDYHKQEPKITLELTQQEASGLLNCLMRTSANGKDLDVGEIIEEKLWEFLKPLETK